MKQKLRKILGDKDHLGRRYAVFFVGLFICSFGVALTTKAGLGTSPVSSIPYSLSLIITNVSFGNWLIALCIFQIIVQIILLRKNCVPSELVIQGILAFAYGYLVDFSMLILKRLEIGSYIGQILFLLLGCAVLAFGVYLELAGGVAMLSGDAFIKAIAQVSRKPYSSVKIVIDIIMSVIAGALCLIFLGKLEGVREGTVIAALIVGIFIKYCQKIFGPVLLKLIPEEADV